ncbi:hypothetical protein HY605_00935 [Candidatus Peregrinibacteria bacterium]|nr:hypothetical protein [Candidatus Peregrinibacteria bacterium]
MKDLLPEEKRTPNGNGVVIKVDPKRVKGKIDPNVFGLHLEHIWNCVYPCVWVGAGSDIDNTDGIRNDTLELLSALRPTVFKYPGGYFTDFYDWRDGTGPREKRPAREYPCVPGRVESNAFGTAEFMTLCRLVGAEPYLSVNTTSIQASDAAHWVEYCNGTRATYWANRRRADGYDEPFGVRYWAIGNEPYWLHTPEAYAERFRLWAHWMSNVDPSIRLVAGGLEPGQEFYRSCNVDGTWGERFIRESRGLSWLRSGWHATVEENQVFYSIHPYFNATADCTREGYYAALEELLTRLPGAIAAVGAQFDEVLENAPRPKLVFDEYGMIHQCRMDGNMTQPTPFWDALWLGVFFHICFEHADEIGIVTHPGPINMEHALLLLEEGQVVATPSYHLFKIYRDHGGGEVLETEVYGAPAFGKEKIDGVRVCASKRRESKEILISVVNLDLDRTLATEIQFAGKGVRKASAQELFAEDIHAANSVQSPNAVVPAGVSVELRDGRLACRLLPHSVTVFRIETEI